MHGFAYQRKDGTWIVLCNSYMYAYDEYVALMEDFQGFSAYSI